MPKSRRTHRATRFDEMALSEELVQELYLHGYERAFEIQEAILPDALAGRDVLARAQTGSGKTLAFTLSMCARFRHRSVHRRRPLGLVLVPTRELAVQVVDTIHPFARAVGIKAQLVAGGMNIEKQALALRKGVEIIVATPGRVKDLALRGDLFLDRIETTVIDEADHMADLGFLPAIIEILQQIPMGSQKMLFSATLDEQVDEITDRFLVDPVTHQTTEVAATVRTMSHISFAINPKKKREITAQIANRKGRTLIFTRTQLGAERVAAELVEVGVKAAALHGNKQQGLRTNVLAGFKQGAFDVLVATEVAARGIHIDDISLVLHYDPASDQKEYVHRSGRTARAGAKGLVATLVLPHQVQLTKKVQEKAQVVASWAEIEDQYAPELRAVGASAPSGQAVEDPQLVKYKGAPRKLDISKNRGANSLKAQQRRENELRRAVYEESSKPSAGKGARGEGRGRGEGRARGEGRNRRPKPGANFKVNRSQRRSR